MLKHLETKLYKSIINSNLFFINERKKNSKLKSLGSFKCLNVLELMINIKQYIRIIQFLKKRKDFSLIFSVNKYYHCLLQKYFNTYYHGKNDIFLQQLFDTTNIRIKKNKIKILLESPLKKIDLFTSHQSQNNIFLIQAFINIHQPLLSGLYNVFSNSLDIKKVLYFITIVNIILSTNAPNRKI